MTTTIQEELSSAAPPQPTVLTIGTFDGVHLGHQHLLGSLKKEASRTGCMATVITFRNHPRTVLRPSQEVSYITSLEERITLLHRAGADLVIPVDFTRQLSLMGAREFVSLLVETLAVRGLVIGPDFALGREREGNVQTVKALGQELDFEVKVVEPFAMGEVIVKSSQIRAGLGQGDVKRASQMLGRLYSLSGLVVKGEERGKSLGFPTANLSLEPDLVIPADGIYATWTVLDGQRYLSATSVGVRPTFGTGQRLVESFLLDFEGDLYGKALTLEFDCRLRDEIAFPTVEALVEQIKQDVAQTRAILAS